MNRSSNSRVDIARAPRSRVVQALTAALDRLELLAHAARFLGAVPDADHLDLLAFALLRPQRLAEPSRVLRDQARGGGKDVRRRSVILLEPNDLAPGKSCSKRRMLVTSAPRQL